METVLTETILTPVLALVIWSLVMWAWMYATRIPAMQKAGIKPQDNAVKGPNMAQLPDSVRQVADNYNHLMEQPTIFYALAFYTYLAGNESATTIMIAWFYVILRVVHSLIQATVNIVLLRFAVFSVATLLLVYWSALSVMALHG